MKRILDWFRPDNSETVDGVIIFIMIIVVAVWVILGALSDGPR